MLDKAKVLAQLQQLGTSLFLDNTAEYSLAQEIWQRIIADPDLPKKLENISSPWSIPQWQGKIDAVISLNESPSDYAVIAVDGSQIYPDRHEGTPCSLINIGQISIKYGKSPTVILENQPYIKFPLKSDELSLDPIEAINCERQELEFVHSIQKGRSFKEQNPEMPFLVVCDGALLFWHLESKEPQVKQFFLNKYISLLQQFYEEKIPLIGYISLPKSKELLSVLKAAICDFDIEGCVAHKAFDTLVDSHIARFFLEPFSRTTIFKSTVSISASYPVHLAPHFFYVDVDTEIARIEIPAWIAHDENLLSFIGAVVKDQVIKGRGYPVTLAEAHEQAVVKGPDREFFYQLIRKLSIDQQQRICLSAKSMRKRHIGI